MAGGLVDPILEQVAPENQELYGAGCGNIGSFRDDVPHRSVDPLHCPLSEHALATLQAHVDPLCDSDNYGVDLFTRALMIASTVFEE
jgi:hypothetical protein